ncbi:unnamed protein product [Ilex paraguariensis]|uniref:Uncharacterized protein n=1 Tax=Ilex paraguariensis TaxID=185542 RepID=A0ABC8RL28_9AQUA
MEENSRSWRQAETKNHMSIQNAPDDVNLVLSIKEKMEDVSLLSCICRVSEGSSEDNENMYFPKFVSIGPLHNKNDSLKATEDQKWRYLNALLGRKPNLEARLDHCVKALKILEQKARKCYQEEIDMQSNEFVKMLLLDGCFIIEFFLKYAIKGLRRSDDPCFNTRDRFFRLRCDLILLENQIPFFVLQQLFHLVPIPRQCSQSLTELALHFFRIIIPGDIQYFQEKFGEEYFNHLLDLVRQCYLPTYLEVQFSGEQKILYCATKLKEVGIGFKKATTTTLLNIKFVDGVIKIPPFKIQNHTEILFRNFIAMEHCHLDCTKYITSYAILMEQLICSDKDVRLLHQRRILPNGLDKGEEILALFKKLHVNIDVKDFYYRSLGEQVHGYERTKWHQRREVNFSKFYLYDGFPELVNWF